MLLYRPPPSLLPSVLFFFSGQVYRLPSVAAAGAATQGELADDGLDKAIPDDWEYLSKETGPEDKEVVACGEGAEVDGGLGLGDISLEVATDGGSEGEAGDEEAGEEKGSHENGEAESEAVMDERLIAAFLNGLKKTLKDKDLPMLVRCVTVYGLCLFSFRWVT